MPISKIHNMDIITNPCPIWRSVIVPKNIYGGQLTRCNFYYIRHQVIRYSFRILTDQSRLVRTYWIKVPQQCYTP